MLLKGLFLEWVASAKRKTMRLVRKRGPIKSDTVDKKKLLAHILFPFFKFDISNAVNLFKSNV